MSDAEQKERGYAIIDCLAGLSIGETIEIVSRVLYVLGLQTTEEA